MEIDVNAPGEQQGPLDELLHQMRRLQASFDAKIRHDESRERLVQSMSEELAAQREQQTQRQVRPILVDLVAMHDDMTKIAEAPGCTPETAKVLGYFRDMVEQTLARAGADLVTVEGDAVDRRQQRVISTVPTSDPAADRLVAERLRPGFRWYEQVLRPEWVRVFRFVAPADAAVASQPEPDPAAAASSDQPGGSPPDEGVQT